LNKIISVAKDIEFYAFKKSRDNQLVINEDFRFTLRGNLIHLKTFNETGGKSKATVTLDEAVNFCNKFVSTLLEIEPHKKKLSSIHFLAKYGKVLMELL
jgi:hypothetical protein